MDEVLVEGMFELRRFSALHWYKEVTWSMKSYCSPIPSGEIYFFSIDPYETVSCFLVVLSDQVAFWKACSRVTCCEDDYRIK